MTDLLPLLRAYRAGDDPAILARAADEIERLRAALEFYADRGTYVGFAFLGAPPHRRFFDDFDDALCGDRIHPVPGRRARAALADQEPDHADR